MMQRALSGSLALAVVVMTTIGLSAGCSSSSLGPANGTSCNVDSDCASNCCAAGFDADAMMATSKICSEPTACQDGSVPPGNDSGTDATEGDSNPGAETSTLVDSSTADTGSVEDSSTGSGDTGSPGDAGGGG